MQAYESFAHPNMSDPISLLWKKKGFLQSACCVLKVAYVCVWKIKRECSLFNLCLLNPLPLILTEAQEIFQCKSIADWRKPHPSPSLYPMIPVIHFFSLTHTSCLIPSHMSGMFTVLESLRGVNNPSENPWHTVGVCEYQYCINWACIWQHL